LAVFNSSSRLRFLDPDAIGRSLAITACRMYPDLESKSRWAARSIASISAAGTRTRINSS
jgi:hypothetical protein